MFLVDTDVISAVAPTKAFADAEASEWVRRNGGAMFLSVVTVAELRRGVALLAGKGATKKSVALAEWQQELETQFGDRIFPIDDGTAPRRRSARRRRGARAQAGPAGCVDRRDRRVAGPDGRHSQSKPLFCPGSGAPRAGIVTVLDVS